MTISTINVGCQSYIEFEKMRFKFIFTLLLLLQLLGLYISYLKKMNENIYFYYNINNLIT